MNIIDLKHSKYLDEYIMLCNKEWGTYKSDLDSYIKRKRKEILEGDNYILILGLTNNDKLIGFISLFRKDGLDTKLTPWYATMYVKLLYRGNGYSKILNKELLKKLGHLGIIKYI